MDDLTKEQQRFIVALYKEYLDRKATMANEKAKILPDAAYIQEHIFPAYAVITAGCYMQLHEVCV